MQLGEVLFEWDHPLEKLRAILLREIACESHFGAKCEANAKITYKSHQAQLVARNFSFGTHSKMEFSQQGGSQFPITAIYSDFFNVRF